MIHAAIMGAIERFLSIFIEHHAGIFPLWLAPTQIGLLPVAPAHVDYARDVEQALKAKGVRVAWLDPEQTLGKRIREGEQARIPYLLVVGEKEAAEKTVTVRNIKTKKQEVVGLEQFVAQVVEDVVKRRLELSVG